ncbi:YveK family protein [Gordonia sp. NPDC003376]
MEFLKSAWYVFRRRWPILLVLLAIGLIGGSIYNVTQKSSYTATTMLFLRAPEVKTSVSAYQGDLFSRQRAQTYVSLIDSNDLAQEVVDKLGLPMSPSQVSGMVSAETVKDTVIIDISATNSDAQEAADIANGYASVFGKYVAEVENVETNPDIPPLVTVIKPASADSAARGGYPLWLVILVAVAAALVVGIALIWFLERFDSKIRSRKQIEDIAVAPVLGAFDRSTDLDDLGSAGDQFAEGIAVAVRQRLILANVIARADTGGVVVTVVGDRDGVETGAVSVSLARGLATSGATVSVLGLGGSVLEAFVAGSSERFFDVVTLPTAAADEIAVRKVLVEMRASSDFTVVAASSVRESVTAEIAIAAGDGAVVTVSPGRSTVVGLDSATRMVGDLGKPLLGVVVGHARETSTINGLYV